MTKYDRLGFLKSDGTPEIETWGVGSEMLSLKDDLKKRPRCLLVGFMGDSVWDRELTTISRDLKWKLRAGQNLTEMRLATNFVYIPAAFIGAQISRKSTQFQSLTKCARGRFSMNMIVQSAGVHWKRLGYRGIYLVRKNERRASTFMMKAS